MRNDEFCITRSGFYKNNSLIFKLVAVRIDTIIIIRLRSASINTYVAIILMICFISVLRLFVFKKSLRFLLLKLRGFLSVKLKNY